MDFNAAVDFIKMKNFLLGLIVLALAYLYIFVIWILSAGLFTCDYFTSAIALLPATASIPFRFASIFKQEPLCSEKSKFSDFLEHFDQNRYFLQFFRDWLFSI